MDVFNDLISYPEDPTRFFDFSRFADEAGDFVLIPGLIDFSRLRELDGQRIVYLEFEEPNRFVSPDPLFQRQEYDDAFWRVFTICPYSAGWLNTLQGSNKRTPVFFPINEAHVPRPAEKEFDVIYTGHILAPPVRRIVEAISKFDYRVVSHSDDPLVTNQDATYQEKLNLMGRSRVTIVANLLYLNEEHIRILASIPSFRTNEAFRLIPFAPRWLPARRRSAVAPQLKSRLFEAAACGSLILCQRDPFSIAERFFTPGEEFIYFDAGKLEQTLESVLSDYDRFLPVVERARQRTLTSYTTAAFFERYLRSL